MPGPRTRMKIEIHKNWRKLSNIKPVDIEYFLKTKAGQKRANKILNIKGIGKKKASFVLHRLCRMKRHGFHTWTDYDWIIALGIIDGIQRECVTGRDSLIVRSKKKIPRRKPALKMTNKYLNCLLWGHDPLKAISPTLSFRRFINRD